MEKQKGINRIVKLFALFVLTLFVLVYTVACIRETDDRTISSDGSRHKGIAIADAYIAESYSIDNIQGVHYALSHGNVIYFSGFEYPNDFREGDTIADSEVHMHLYLLDMEMDEPETQKILYDHKTVEPTSFVSSFSINHDGSINLAVVDLPNDWERGAKFDIYLKRIDLKGNEISRIKLSEDMQYDEYIYPQNLTVDAVGKIYLSNGNTIYVWDQQGRLLNKTTINGHNLNMSLDYSRKKVYAVWSGNYGGSKIAAIDSDSGSLGQSYDLEDVYSCYGITPSFGSDSDFLMATDNGIFVYNVESRSHVEIIRWSSVSMSIDNGMFLPLSDGRFGWYESKHPNNGVDLHVIRPLHENEELPEKETLVIGGVSFFIDDSLRAAVAEFNATHPLYRLEIKQYANDNTDYNEGITQFNLDIVNGKGPDIIVLPQGISMWLYAERGVLTNLYPFIDNNLERSDFQENVIKAYESDGQLFGMPVFYQIRTLIAPASEVGDIKKWNLDEMISYANNQLPDSRVFDDHSKSGVLSLCLRANGEALVDWTSDESGFQRELFLKILYFANQFTPDHLYVYNDDIIDRIQIEKQIQLLSGMVGNYNFDHQLYTAYFGEQLAYLGFPSESGNGNLITSVSVLAINQNSQHKEAAWDFISSMLTEEFQTRTFIMSSLSFPILKSAHEVIIERAMEVKYDYEDGIKKEQPFEKIRVGDFVVDIYAATERDIEAVRNLINSADKIRIYDEQIINIVMEEAQYFFSGAKSAEEVADIAENRIRIYVNEMK
ncbi:MAG: ABC transporter substrate-binding protein [Lachnospiraceae bacterium]|jgi:ABC-type glycerol-3-phosphate transport system substrate-binding protein|nr:ABC transporter substrate-binding protein [Lachnospiraceae bacterium]